MLTSARSLANSLSTPLSSLLRFLLLSAFAFWLGGFTFYGSVVIPVGHRVLGSHTAVGFITQSVSLYFNRASGVALVCAGIALVEQRRMRQWSWTLAGLWAGCLLCLVILIVMHPSLDVHMDQAHRTLLDPDLFARKHRLYLLVATAQWAAGSAMVFLFMWIWRREDLERMEKA